MSYSRCFVLLLLGCALCVSGCGYREPFSAPPGGIPGPAAAVQYYKHLQGSRQVPVIDPSIFTSDLALSVKRIQGAAFPQQFSNPEGYPVVWLSDNIIAPANGGSIYSPVPVKAIDLSDGPAKTEPGLTRVSTGCLLMASPNGKWVLWRNSTNDNRSGTLFATRIVDGKTVSWPITTFDARAFWLPDSRHVVSVGHTAEGIGPAGSPVGALDVSIFDIVTSKTVHKVYPGIYFDIQSVYAQGPSKIVMCGTSVVNGSINAVALARLDVNSNPPALQTLNVIVPSLPGSPEGTFCISPRVDKIVWRFDVWPSQRALGYHKPNITNIFYMTNLDGSNLHPVGYLRGGSTIPAMNMSPDGDKVAVYYRNRAAVISLPRSALEASASERPWFNVPFSTNGGPIPLSRGAKYRMEFEARQAGPAAGLPTLFNGSGNRALPFNSTASPAPLSNVSRQDTVSGDLKSRLRFVGNAGPSSSASGFNGYPVVWLTDSNVIVANSSWNWQWAGWSVVDLTDGSTKMVSGSTPTNQGNLISTSYDGKWIAWCDTSKGSGSWTLAATRLTDGKTVESQLGTNGLATCWLRDNRHIVSVGDVDAGISPYTGREYFASGITLFDVSNGTVVHRLLSGADYINAQVVRADSSGNLVMSGSPTAYSSETKTVTLYRVNLHTNPLTVQTLTVPSPTVPGSQNVTYFISPNADRIVWHYTSYDHPGLNLFSFHDTPPIVRDDFYVTDIDGSHLQKVGELKGAYCPWMTSVSPEGDKIGVAVGNQAAIIPLPGTDSAAALSAHWTTPPHYAAAAPLSPAMQVAEQKQLTAFNSAEARQNIAAGQPLAGSMVNAVGVSGRNIYAGTNIGLSVSRDNGLHWSMPDALTGTDITRISVSGSVAYIGTGNGLYVSRDNGLTWREDNPFWKGHSLGLADGPAALDVLRIAASGPIVCVSTNAAVGGLYISRDNGATWSRPQIGNLSYVYATGLAVTGSNIYVETPNELYVSRDGGETFSQDGSLLRGWSGRLEIGGIAAYGSTVCAPVTETLCISGDNGETWTEVNIPIETTQRLVVDGTTVGAAADGWGVQISVDGGHNWATYRERNGLASDSTNDLAISGKTICVGTGRGLSVSHDRGLTWTNYL